MPRLRSQTGFTRILPPELVERCLESLQFEVVHTTVKQVSKEVTERLGESALVTRSGSRWWINLDELLNTESLLGSGLESWAEPGDMVSFIDWLRDWTDADVHLMNEAAEALSSQWRDRRKAGAFVEAVASKVEQWFNDYGPDY